MKTLDWYFDFISPFAYLQFAYLQNQYSWRLPTNAQVRFKPVLLAGLLNHWGSKGPAEIPAKRVFTYRQVLWLARQHEISLRIPPAHPFNPLKALRLAIALDSKTNVVQEIFYFFWRAGHDADDPVAWTELLDKLQVKNAEELTAKPEVKNALRHNTEEAIARGVFGVPTLWVEGELFWGFDTTAMLLAYLKDPALFKDPEMQRISNLPVGAQRL